MASASLKPDRTLNLRCFTHESCSFQTQMGQCFKMRDKKKHCALQYQAPQGKTETSKCCFVARRMRLAKAHLITIYSRETLYTLILGQKYDHLKALSGEHIKCKMCSVFSCGYWQEILLSLQRVIPADLVSVKNSSSIHSCGILTTFTHEIHMEQKKIPQLPNTEHKALAGPPLSHPRSHRRFKKWCSCQAFQGVGDSSPSINSARCFLGQKTQCCSRQTCCRALWFRFRRGTGTTKQQVNNFTIRCHAMPSPQGRQRWTEGQTASDGAPRCRMWLETDPLGSLGRMKSWAAAGRWILAARPQHLACICCHILIRV